MLYYWGVFYYIWQGSVNMGSAGTAILNLSRYAILRLILILLEIILGARCKSKSKSKKKG